MKLLSIVDFLDPTVLGPLFRFNRDYFTFDERGRPNGYRNLDKLRALRPCMLRRHKADVENELPQPARPPLLRAAVESQRRHYAHHERRAGAGLIFPSQRRSLLPREDRSPVPRAGREVAWSATLRIS